jgi:hypothetical protein
MRVSLGSLFRWFSLEFTRTSKCSTAVLHLAFTVPCIFKLYFLHLSYSNIYYMLHIETVPVPAIRLIVPSTIH